MSMNHPTSSPAAPTADPKRKKPLDTVVKLALGVLFSAFGLIWGGMYLSRPDRSIPPYSVGSQDETLVAVHVPSYTSDPEIEALIERFRKVGREGRNFGAMKIRPTTPDDPQGRYRRLSIYIFTHEAWAEAEVLRKFKTGEDQAMREGFERALRGFYRLEDDEEEGRIGPILHKEDSAAMAAYARQLFKGPMPAPTGDLDGSTHAR